MATKRPASREATAYPRRRAVTACQVCRARRTKCDNAKPACSFCVKVGAKCIQSTVDVSSFDPASIRILERLDEIDTNVNLCRNALEEGRAAARSPASFGRRPLSQSNGASPFQSQPPLAQRVHRSQIIPQSVKSISAWPCLNLQDPAHMGPIRSPTEEAWDEQQAPSALAVGMVQLQNVTGLVDRFFKHVHVKNPILDEGETRRMITRLTLYGLDMSPESCLAMLVCALGSISVSFESRETVTKDSDSFTMGASFFLAAQKRLGLVIGAGLILESQCFFLAGVYMMTIFKRYRAWRYFLQALSCCQQFDFLNPATESADEPSTSVTQDPYRLTRDQAIYWSSWKSERELRLELEPIDFIPSTSELAVYPPFFPTPPAAQGTGAFEQDNDDELKRRSSQSWYYYLSEISLRRLYFRIMTRYLELEMSEGNGFFLEAAAGTISEHLAQVKDWARTLPDIVSFESSPDTDDICRFVLRGMFASLYELIYWPFVHMAVNGSDYQLDGSSASRLLLRSLAQTGLEKHVERIQLDKAGYYHRHHGTPRLLRACSRSALVLMAAASTTHSHVVGGSESPLELPIGWKNAVLSVIKANRFWANESVDSRYLLQVLEAGWEKVSHLEV